MATIKNTASKLLQDISEAAGERVSKKNCKSVICRLASISEDRVDWGNAPTDLQPFCGRIDELQQLTNWLKIDRCKLVGILGIGGIGKTALAAKLGDNIAADFDLAIWRSVREAPPLTQLVGELVQFLSEFTEIEVLSGSDRAISRLLHYLRQKRCLLVLDNIEAIMEAGEYAGNYRSRSVSTGESGYADYGQLFQTIGTSRHQSCLLFTSREPPPEIAELAGVDLPVRSLWLSGLATNAPILLSKIGLNGSQSQLAAVAERCQGNPLYLRIVANTIVNSFNGDIDSFLAVNQYTYGKIANVLQSQLDRLSQIEKLIIYHLAIAREPISLAKIEIHLQPLGYSKALVQTIDSLQQRSLLEVTQGQRYTLQNVVMEFMTGAVLRELVGELTTADLSNSRSIPTELFFFNSLALHPASSPTFVREVQQRSILQPIGSQLSRQWGRDRAIDLLRRLCSSFGEAGLIPGYGAGNIINVLTALDVDLAGSELTDLYIAEVDFQTANLRNVNFTGARFDRCRFANGMGTAIRLTFSPNGRYLAACDTNYQIKVWEVATNQEIAIFIGHQSWVWDVQFSHDCKYIVSGSSDETMRIWDLATGECLQVLHGHRDWVWRVSFAINHNLAISIGADRQVKIWWWRTKLTLLTFPVPDLQVRDGSFQGTRGLLATCGGEGIKIWQVWTGRCIQKIVTERARSLRLVSLSPDGKTIVGANFSCAIHCWDVRTGELLFDLLGHPTQVSEVNYDDTGRMMSTCLEQVRIWNLRTGACVKAIDFGNDCGKAAAYRAPFMATGSDNGVIKVWHLETGQCIATSGGTSARVLGIASNPHHQIVVSSKDDGTLNFWDFGSIEPTVKIDIRSATQTANSFPPSRHYQAHRGMATSLAMSPNGRLVASTGSDRSIKIWDVSTGKQLQTLVGHTDYIPQLLFADDRTIFSRSYDATIRQWDIISGDWEIVNYLQRQWAMVLCRSPDCQSICFGSDTPILTILERQTKHITSYPAIGNRLRQLNFSHDGRYVVGITDDRILNLWDTTSDYKHCHWKIGKRDATTAIPHPKLAHLLIIGSDDGSISIWDLQMQTCLDRIVAHQHEILTVSILAQPDRLVSCSVDGSIKVWGLQYTRLTQIHSIEFGKLYQNLQLTDVKGLNPSQLTTLAKLGAIPTPFSAVN